MVLILIIFILLSWYAGYIIVDRIVSSPPKLFLLIGAFLVGTAIAVPVTYILSCALVTTSHPLLLGTIATTVLLAIVGIQFKRPIKLTFLLSELVFLLFALSFSYWLMFKTFHGDTSGQLFVGSNNIFDFSHVLGIIRSFSFGNNIPFVSPFQAGLPYFYHFFFAFYVAIWEYFGVPIVWAMNIPSIFVFTSLLVVIYYLPQRLFNQYKLVGWIAVLLTITNSTLTWWQFWVQRGLSVQTLKSIWSMQTYPFAGPFDGSMISLFMTLNNYVNQRHLAFAIACALLLVMLMVEQIQQKNLTLKKVFVYGIFFGLLGMWNIAITVIAIISVILLLLFIKLWKQSIIFATTAVVVGLLFFGKHLLLYNDFLVLSKAIVGASSQEAWNAAQYFLMNLGILPIIVFIGYIAVNKKNRIYGLPFLLLGIMLCVVSVIEKRGFDQKFLSFLIIWANVFAAIGVSWLWQRKTIILKFCALCLFAVLTVSGVIDLMPIKNEFAYPLVDSKMLPVISWIQKNTAKDAVFVSYSDMVDPVAFAGRKNYFGFFGNIGSKDRSEDVKTIYAGDIKLANILGISYILVPMWKKNDFLYIVDTMYFAEHNMVVYEDERYSIYSAVIKTNN